MFGHVQYFVVMPNVLLADRIDEVYDLKGSRLNRHGKKGKTLRDGDFNREIFLSSQDKRTILEKLGRDVTFLQENFLLDYSLLLGIHNCWVNRQPGPHCPAYVPRHRKYSIPKPQNLEVAAPEAERKTDFPLDVLVPLSVAEANFRAEVASVSDASSSLPPSVWTAHIIVGPGMYYMGIIDILQSWTLMKRLELQWKRLIYCHDRTGFSVQPPAFYGHRFLKKMAEIFDQSFEASGVQFFPGDSESDVYTHQN